MPDTITDGAFTAPTPSPCSAGWAALMTRARWIEVARIAFMAFMAVLFWRAYIPETALWFAVAIGLYPLLKTGWAGLVRERRVGTEVFVTVATVVALLGGEAAAGAVLLAIILVAEFIADLNMERARASIKDLIGSAPLTATVRMAVGEKTMPIAELMPDDIVLARAGERIRSTAWSCVAAPRSTRHRSPAKASRATSRPVTRCSPAPW